MIDDLYSARVLTLAANLPHAGRLASAQGTGERVAKLCGSKATVDVVLDDEGRIADFAQDVKACALGQAAAGVVGESVIGATAEDLTEARDAMLAMLKAGGEGPTGRFEGLRLLKQVADYPARHASTMVAIEATLEAVEQASSSFSLGEKDCGAMTLYERGVRAAHRGYKLTLSPVFGQSCRFLPTCSDYGRDALIQHGLRKGGWLTVRRLCRCHPFGGSGYDPVPPKET